MIIIKLKKTTYRKLKNVLIWADLYDKEKNNSKNSKVYDAILKELNYLEK